MNYYFRDFQFKSDQLVLIKMEQTVSLRANEAKLLTLLLSDPQRVFSKQQILENVWAGKNVAEQSIFQNISNLRNIFGDDAITTHPKKGYQWQIPLEQPPEQKVTKPQQKINQRFKYSVLLVSLLIIITIVVSLVKPASLTADSSVIALMPIEANNLKNADISENERKLYNQLLIDALNEKDKNLVILAKDGNSFSRLQASPSILVPVEKIDKNAELILSTKVKKYKSEFFITFNLLAENNAWQGVISANALENATEQLAQQIKIVIDSNI
jgi:DNA-binding winged helix-turn-helix (wHTH) protein